MAFDKEQYWLDKPNNIASKRPKALVMPSKDVEVSFDEKGLIVKNRAYRRSKKTNNVYKKKGFYEYLSAILVIRKRHGKITKKYVKINESVI